MQGRFTREPPHSAARREGVNAFGRQLTPPGIPPPPPQLNFDLHAPTMPRSLQFSPPMPDPRAPPHAPRAPPHAPRAPPQAPQITWDNNLCYDPTPVETVASDLIWNLDINRPPFPNHPTHVRYLGLHFRLTCHGPQHFNLIRMGLNVRDGVKPRMWFIYGNKIKPPLPSGVFVDINEYLRKF
jgi:hypothetical protein